MTLEKLLIIVSNAVERAITLSRLKVTVFAFEDSSTEETLKAARIINGSAIKLTPEMHDCGDVLFLDCIPLEYLPKLVLGICDEPICRQIIMTVSQGKTVFVLKKSNEDLRNAPAVCLALLDTYRRFLKSSGYVFLDSYEVEGTKRAAQRSFDGKLLARGDLLSCIGAGTKEIIVNSDCVVTMLAAETAKSMNITIKKQIF